MEDIAIYTNNPRYKKELLEVIRHHGPEFYIRFTKSISDDNLNSTGELLHEQLRKMTEAELSLLKKELVAAIEALPSA